MKITKLVPDFRRIGTIGFLTIMIFAIIIIIVVALNGAAAFPRRAKVRVTVRSVIRFPRCTAGKDTGVF